MDLATNTETELWELIYGMEFAWKTGERKLTIESNSKVSIQLSKEASKDSPHHNLIRKAQEGLGMPADARLEGKQLLCVQII